MGAIVTISDLALLDQIFQFLKLGYEGICKNQMQKIQDFQRENDNIPCNIYTRLAEFAKESGDAFIEWQLVQLYMSKHDKKPQRMVEP